jgi:hypothetical protein
MDDKLLGKYLFLIVAAVAVVGLLSTGANDITGFAVNDKEPDKRVSKARFPSPEKQVRAKFYKKSEKSDEPMVRTTNLWCEKAKTNYASAGCEKPGKISPRCLVFKKDLLRHCAPSKPVGRSMADRYGKQISGSSRSKDLCTGLLFDEKEYCSSSLTKKKCQIIWEKLGEQGCDVSEKHLLGN